MADGTSFKLHKDQSYTDSLTQTAPPPPGEHWVGYRSDSTFPSTTTFTFTPRFQLPRGADGSPFHGPFTWRTVTGVFFDQSGAGGDPVVCAANPTQPNGSPPSDTSTCIDSPQAADQNDPAVATDNSLPTRELQINGGSNASVAAGGDATIAFSADFAGTADPAIKFTLAGETTIPDAVATPSQGTLEPATDSRNPVTLKLHVDPTVEPGSYDVGLVARLANGVERRQTVKVAIGVGKPVALTVPDITGTFAVGQTVTCAHGSWTGPPTGYAYEWTRDGTTIGGAGSSTYKLTQDDGATLVGCRVTATNAVGSGVAPSPRYHVAQTGGADVDLSGPASVDAGNLVDPGISVACPVRLPKNCGAGLQLTTAVDAVVITSANKQHVVLTVGHGGFTIKSGGKVKLKLHLTHGGAKLLRRKGRLPIVATLTTRSHSLERVTSRKRFTLKP